MVRQEIQSQRFFQNFISMKSFYTLQTNQEDKSIGFPLDQPI